MRDNFEKVAIGGLPEANIIAGPFEMGVGYDHLLAGLRNQHDGSGRCRDSFLADRGRETGIETG